MIEHHTGRDNFEKSVDGVALPELELTHRRQSSAHSFR